jgi:hypothetical protein
MSHPVLVNNAGCSSSPTADDDSAPIVEEETWTTADGTNVFDELVNQQFELRHLQLSSSSSSSSSSSRILKYKSYPESAMTPLDMTYSEKNNYSNKTSADAIGETTTVMEDFQQSEFYDGTGTLVWLAALALVWAIDQDTRGIIGGTTNDSDRRDGNIKPKTSRRPTLICELGCGTGLPGMAALLLSNRTMESRAADGATPDQHVIFTDIDEESLANCRQNCHLNEIPPERYSHHLLSWGIPDSYPENKAGSVDIILAADVLYDMKMIPPLFQTAADLLRAPPAVDSPKNTSSGDHALDENGSHNIPFTSQGGVMILSHIPRFCLPRENNDDRQQGGGRGEDSNTMTPVVRSQTQPFDDLEAHIISQAESFGLTLKDQFRPHEELRIQESLIRPEQANDMGFNKKEEDPILDGILTETVLQRFKTMHAVIFVFQAKY